MGSRLFFNLRRELPGALPRILLVVGIAAALILPVARCTRDESATKKEMKAADYAFDQCAEAMLRDGNGIVQKADTCARASGK